MYAQLSDQSAGHGKQFLVFRDMPLYPSDGSIHVQGDRVIVKLASKYTPKKDYEIAYENRR